MTTPAALYLIGVFGHLPARRFDKFKATIKELVAPLGLAREVKVVKDAAFHPRPDFASAVVFFGKSGQVFDGTRLDSLMKQGTPVLPVVDDLKVFSASVPACLRPINGLQQPSGDKGYVKAANLALQALGLLPKQRRIFLSYRQKESRAVAVQLFEYLSSLNFEVFLDTHGVPPGEDFQEVLWHRLSDSDVLVMLDTRGYFESRWTSEEFGKALAQSLQPVRIGWPGVARAARAYVAEDIQLRATDLVGRPKVLRKATLANVALAIERARSRGIAVRSTELTDAVKLALAKVGGKYLGVGPARGVVAQLPGGKELLVVPTVTVPRAEHLHEVSELPWKTDDRAVVFDDSGVHHKWQQHLDWLGGHVKSARWLKKAKAAEVLALW